jgi:RNA methyltransferase, TrmH family
MPTSRITSRHNPLVARYRAAARGESAELLLDGVHLIGEALAAGIRLRHAAVAAAKAGESALGDLVRRIEAARVEVVAASAPVMAALSPVKSASAVVALAERPSTSDSRLYGARPFVVVAADVQDPGNLGAIVRVAEAGGASGVVAVGACADPYGWKALRGSMGSALRLPIAVRRAIADAIADARTRGCRIVATTPRGGRPLFEVDFTPPTAVLIGGEGAGLPAAAIDASDERVTIPMAPAVESLNAAVTAALVVYESRRQR